jgi:hypothetical protein
MASQEVKRSLISYRSTYFLNVLMPSSGRNRKIMKLFENLLCRVLGRYFVPILSLEAVDDFNF